MTIRDTINATAMPKIKITASAPVIAKPNFTIFNALIPNITGTARKNVNSAAATRETPISNAPTMVAPDLDVPGIIDRT